MDCDLYQQQLRTTKELQQLGTPANQSGQTFGGYAQINSAGVPGQSGVDNGANKKQKGGVKGKKGGRGGPTNRVGFNQNAERNYDQNNANAQFYGQSGNGYSRGGGNNGGGYYGGGYNPNQGG